VGRTVRSSNGAKGKSFPLRPAELQCGRARQSKQELRPQASADGAAFTAQRHSRLADTNRPLRTKVPPRRGAPL